MAAIIEYRTVDQDSVDLQREENSSWTERDKNRGFKARWNIIKKVIVIPFVESFDDNIYKGFGNGYGIEAMVKIVTTSSGKEVLKFTSEESAQKFIDSLKIEIEDFYGNYTKYVKTID